jgi:hypothetical protein
MCPVKPQAPHIIYTHTRTHLQPGHLVQWREHVLEEALVLLLERECESVDNAAQDLQELCVCVRVCFAQIIYTSSHAHIHSHTLHTLHTYFRHAVVRPPLENELVEDIVDALADEGPVCVCMCVCVCAIVNIRARRGLKWYMSLSP